MDQRYMYMYNHMSWFKFFLGVKFSNWFDFYFPTLFRGTDNDSEYKTKDN